MRPESGTHTRCDTPLIGTGTGWPPEQVQSVRGLGFEAIGGPTSSVQSWAEQFRAVSFDVFDTTLSRSVPSPTAIFRLLESRVGARPAGSWRFPLAQARIAAESLARRATWAEEITLDEIYLQLGRLEGIVGGSLATIKEAELSLEEELSFALPRTVELVHRLQRLGKRVFFVSDCYLPEDFVRGLLVRGGVEIGPGDIYVSSRWRATKHRGSLFRKIAGIEGLGFHEWCHLGDNPKSDVRSPRKLGIAGELLALPAECTEAERRIAPRKTRVWRAGSNPIRQALAGVLRKQRLTLGPEARDPDMKIGFELIGPLLLPFVCWALRETRRQGIEDVFFPARDGQILMRLSEAVVRKTSLGMRLHYLAVSRQSLNLPTFGLPGVSDSWLWESDIGISPERLAKRLGLPVNEVVQSLKGMGITISDPGALLSAAEVGTAKRQMPGSSLQRLALESAAEARRSSVGYLDQKGVFAPECVSIIDLGWRGTLQDRVATLSRIAGSRTLYTGYFMGALEGGGPYQPGKRALLFDSRRQAWAALVGIQSIVFFEILTRGTHGTTLRYQDEGGRFVPVFDGEDADHGDIERTHAGAVEFVEACSRGLLGELLDSPERLLKNASFGIMSSASLRPPVDEAEHLGKARFSGEQGETPTGEVAPPLRGWQALMAVASCSIMFPGGRTYWLGASLARGRSRLASPLGLMLRAFFVMGKGVRSRFRWVSLRILSKRKGLDQIPI